MSKRISGVYYDPQHGKCVRTIQMHEGQLCIYGVYGVGEGKSIGEEWTANVFVDAETQKLLTVYFQKDVAQERRVMHALWCPEAREIHWEDGSVWYKLYSVFDIRA